jgi:hypothetical protein
MATSETDLAQLDAAIARFAISGVETVEFNGQRTTYRSLDEIVRARQLLAGSVAPAAPQSRQVQLIGSKGV